MVGNISWSKGKNCTVRGYECLNHGHTEMCGSIQNNLTFKTK